MTRLLAALVLFLALPAAAQAPIEPPPVTFLPGGATSGACRAQWQTTATVQARSAPTDASAATRAIDGRRRVDANDYSESVTAVLQAGRVRLAGPVRVGGVPPLELARGEEIRVLAQSGGFWTFVYGGRVYRDRLDGAEVLQAPVTETWVFLVPRDDRAAAWLNTAQAGVIPWDAACGE